MTQTFITTLMLTSFVAVATAQQPPPMPKPGAEQQNLARFAGTWKMDAKMEASPLGPGGAITGTESCKMMEGGWHLVCESTGTGPMGTMKGYAIMSYDRAARQYRYFSVNSQMPDAEMATGTKTATGWTWTSTLDIGGGKTLHGRFVIVDKSPTVYSYVWEMSDDGGKTWKKTMEGTSTKSGS